MTLNGTTTTLVNGSGKWVPSADGGQTVKQSGNTWEVIQPDGTQYWFGLNQLPGYAAGDQATNSLWTVPVLGRLDRPRSAPCPGGTTSTTSSTRTATPSVLLHPQANSYAEQNGTTANATYTQGGVLTTIEYGLRAGQVYTSAPAAQVNFTSAPGRQDAPTDLACSAGSACAINSPTFWNKCPEHDHHPVARGHHPG